MNNVNAGHNTDQTIQNAIYNLYLNIDGFPVLTPAEYKGIKIVGTYNTTGIDFKKPHKQVVVEMMKNNGIEFDPTRHLIIHLPPTQILFGPSSKYIIFELPRPINNNV